MQKFTESIFQLLFLNFRVAVLSVTHQGIMKTFNLICIVFLRSPFAGNCYAKLKVSIQRFHITVFDRGRQIPLYVHRKKRQIKWNRNAIKIRFYTFCISSLCPKSTINHGFVPTLVCIQDGSKSPSWRFNMNNRDCSFPSVARSAPNSLNVEIMVEICSAFLYRAILVPARATKQNGKS